MFDVPAGLRDKVCSAWDAAGMIPDGAVVAASGYTAAGDPKATLLALAGRGREGDIHAVDLITAAQLSQQVENSLAEAGILRRRAPFTTARSVRQLANRQELHYVEVPMSKMPRLVSAGAFGIPDVAVVEALDLDVSGRLLLTASVGITPLLCRMARHIIVEINTAQPEELEGVHDICGAPEHGGLTLRRVNERLGEARVQIDPEKIIAIVFSDRPDEEAAAAETGSVEAAVCRRLQEFLEYCCAGTALPPIQTGIGGLSQAILHSFWDSRYRDLEFFCGALQAEMIDLLAAGKAQYLSGGAIVTGAECRRKLKAFGPELKKHVVLRGMEVCNGAAAAAGLGILALNTGVEADMFGNVNSSHACGGSVVNGIGGGAAFAANSALSILLMPSVRKGGRISSFVPCTPHVDIVHHDIDVVISEQGIADLRGKDDMECAGLIIENCVHPAYQDALRRELAAAKKGGGHHPVRLGEAFSWHERLRSKGSMAEDGPSGGI